ncbi:MAG: hypothetical protein ACREFX_08105 [Opitutaceae bacterium]
MSIQSISHRWSVPAALSLSLVLAAGCSVRPSVALTVPVSDGETLHLLFDPKGGVPHADDGIIRIGAPRMIPEPKLPRVAYTFALLVKDPTFVPVRVMVEDFTDKPVHVLVDDHKPVLNHDRVWGTLTPYMGRGAPALKWLSSIDYSIRDYRFIVTAADGRTRTLDQLSLYPVGVKDFVRHKLGYTY